MADTDTVDAADKSALAPQFKPFSALLDIERLVQPISDDAPCGSDLRQDIGPTSAYYRLKDVRSQARSAERDALIDGDPLLSLSHMWRPIAEELPDIIATQSKDLELLAWLIEAYTRIHGFAGLAMGYALTAKLVNDYWGDIHPLPDEDDDEEDRISALVGLNGVDGEGTLLLPISCISLTEELGDAPFSFWEYQQANDISRMESDKRQQKLDSGGINIEDLEAAVKDSSTDFYVGLVAEIEAAQLGYSDAVAAMDGACSAGVQSSNISKRLQDVHDAVAFLAEDKLRRAAPLVNDVDSVTEAEADVGAEAVALNPLTSNVMQREQAIAQLIKIAEFFKETEPHSPVSYSIEQIVRWCDMSLPELLAELIDSGEARQGYFRLVGIANDDTTS
ncbi:type VI secretion system protein TssA [Thaumasiovibrio subtropicus]|uniref:type VI secretion system protein TssA n=1 Tax=Thaumasiovibrio subtropicus TaxID=1891207 RepID=UPI000B351828|nr:type VI secretion system protein TssA [Thaumasiovibrio subtropicus]